MFGPIELPDPIIEIMDFMVSEWSLDEKDKTLLMASLVAAMKIGQMSPRNKVDEAYTRVSHLFASAKGGDL